uniref:Putative TraB n=1 Tax=mine drainage metagenome TaxID=410659 RepID=E6PKM0_9ZZZZ
MLSTTQPQSSSPSCLAPASSLRLLLALRRLLAVLLPALAGLAWTLSDKPYGVILSPLLIIGVMLVDNPRWRFLAALAYFGVGGAALPAEVQRFFGTGWILGVGLWALASVLLALPWAWASRGWRVVVVLLIEAVPPLGLFGWLSPLAVAGVFYPGLGLLGLAFGLAILWTLAVLVQAQSSTSAITLAMVASAALSGMSVWANAAYTPPVAPAGWVGVNTRVGHETDDVMAEVGRNQDWISQAAGVVRFEAKSKSTAGAKNKGLVVVLPEDVAGTWGPGTAAQVRAAMRPGDVWLVGASVLSSRHWDGSYLNAVVGLGQRGDAVLFVSPVPVPGGMWKPWDGEKSYTAAHWWEPVQTIAGVRTWASICYDQGITWPWLQALVQRPTVVLRVSNYWYEPAGAVAPRVEAATTAAWARLMGAAVVTAVNRADR